MPADPSPFFSVFMAKTSDNRERRIDAMTSLASGPADMKWTKIGRWRLLVNFVNIGLASRGLLADPHFILGIVAPESSVSPEMTRRPWEADPPAALRAISSRCAAARLLPDKKIVPQAMNVAIGIIEP
jgi:hypothetical protein